MADAEVKLKVSLDDSSASSGLSDLSNKAKKLDDNVSKSTSSLKDFGTKANKVAGQFAKAGTVLTAGLTTPIIALGTQSVNAALELEATEAKFNTVFGDMSEDVNAFIDEFQKLTPITQAEARSLTSGVQDLLVPLGFAREEATDMTKEFTTVAGALTNFNSATHSAEDVMNAIQSAITGEYTSLKGLGVQLSATSIQQKAVASGLIESDEAYKKLSESEQKQINTQVLLDELYAQSGDALAAYNIESQDTKTKMDIATASLKDASAALGESLIPLVQKGSELIAQFANWINNLTTEQKDMLFTVLGIIAALGPLLLLISGVTSALTFLMSPVGLVIVGIGLLIAAVVLLWKSFDVLKEKAQTVFKAIGDFFISMANTIIGAINSLVEGFLSPFNAIIDGLNKLPGVHFSRLSFSFSKIPMLNVGTNYVAQDGLAFLHKGEAVVPRKYNPAAGGSTTNNSQTIVQNFYSTLVSPTDAYRKKVELANVY